MAATKSKVVAVKVMLVFFFCVMVANIAYLAITPGGYVSCWDFNGRWLLAIVVDFYVYIAAFGGWVAYKESSWIKAIIFMVSMDCLGCIATCGYILFQFFKLSPEESLKDPFYFVLARRHKRDGYTKSGNSSSSSAVIARVIFSALGCFLVGALIYTIIVDITASHAQPFKQCIIANATDDYIHAIILSVWLTYKESSWITAFFWIFFHLCFGSIVACVYIVRELFYLSSDQPAFLIIFKSDHRNLESTDPLLMAQTTV